MIKKAILALGCTALVFGCFSVCPGTSVVRAAESGEDAALAAAQTCLNALDQGAYKQTWEDASEFFKSAVTQEQWKSQIAPVRDSFGALISREPGPIQHLTAIPGAPDGDYYVFFFKTVFAHKAEAVETVTMMKKSDGMWRLAGYFIK